MAAIEIDAFQVIADPTRRKILAILTQGSYNINSLAENFDMSRPAVSKHIKILHNANFVTIQAIGRERRCHLNQVGFTEVQTWLNYFNNFWSEKLLNLEEALNEKRQNE